MEWLDAVNVYQTDVDGAVLLRNNFRFSSDFTHAAEWQALLGAGTRRKVFAVAGTGL